MCLLGLIILFLFSTIPVSSEYDQIHVIYVDSDNIQGPWDGSHSHPFISIQDGIDHAGTGDWVFVNRGSYKENIVIQKEIRLLGEEKATTILDGGGNDDVVSILTDNVILSGFTICNSNHDLEKGLWWKAGIRILGSNVTIIDTIIRDNLQGIFLKQGENLTLLDNQFISDGLTIYPYDTGYTIRPKVERLHFIHQIDNNTVNGKPLVYLVDEENLELTLPMGQIIMVNCSKCRIHNVTLNNTDFPIIFFNCNQCIIEQVDCIQNDGICAFLDSDDNLIRYSWFHQNMHGFLCDYSSEDNIFYQNTFSENSFCGMVCEYHSNNNVITENNFIDNRGLDAFVIKSFSNTWKNNYWSDWIGLEHPVFRLFPELIFGTHFESYQRIKTYINVDWSPSMIRYDFV